ncbi:MAG: PAC2 family protein [Candidatus Thorarchaeota archaeon]|jgi:proteasome assembly chaperone (PAC2) family protein
MDLEESSLKSPIGIVGLPGIANVGKVAIETLTHVLDATHVIDFYSDDLPPRVIVQQGISRCPKSTIHLYNAAPDEPHDLLILTADFQPASGKGVFEYADYVGREFAKFGVKELFSLAAYEQGYPEYFEQFPSPPRIYTSASSIDLLDRITESDGIVKIDEGAIVGANGIIPAWAASVYSMEGACLLGETIGVIKADYWAARSLLQKLANLVGIKAHFDVIDTQVEKVVEFIKWAMEEIVQKGSPSEDAESPPDRYIG